MRVSWNSEFEKGAILKIETGPGDPKPHPAPGDEFCTSNRGLKEDRGGG
jgi:hypothetical protein